MDKIDIPIAGIIENMSYFTPKELPDNKYFIFGQGGGDYLSNRYKVPMLGKIPLVMGVADQADKGVPAILDDENELIKKTFAEIAQTVAQQISIINAKQ
jgi:ATP-binding protein involved in chromosome partitioning